MIAPIAQRLTATATIRMKRLSPSVPDKPSRWVLVTKRATPDATENAIRMEQTRHKMMCEALSGYYCEHIIAGDSGLL